MSSAAYDMRSSRIKTCRLCHVTKPHDEFRRSVKTGRPLVCEACAIARESNDAKLRPPSGMKRCPLCKVVFPVDCFHRSRASKDGRTSRCKPCAKATTHAWYRENQARGLLNSAKARARSFGLEFSIEAGDVEIPSVCPVLGIPIEVGGERGFRWSSPSIDRLDPEGGYTRNNIRIISFRANSVKSDGTADEHRAVANYMDRELGAVTDPTDSLWWAP